MTVLAHGNGLDEVAFVVVPIVLFIAFIVFERRHNQRRLREDDQQR